VGRRDVSIISIIIIIICSNGLLFYFQNLTEYDLRDSLFEQQKQHQIQSNKEISQRIGSVLNLIMSMLYGMADSIYLQQAYRQEGIYSQYFLIALKPWIYIVHSIVNNVISIQRIKMISFFAAASTVAIMVLIILLRKWDIISRK